MASKEMWAEDTGKNIVKTASKAIVVCGALVVFSLTLGAVNSTLTPS